MLRRGEDGPKSKLRSQRFSALRSRRLDAVRAAIAARRRIDEPGSRAERSGRSRRLAI